jgi:hypothetical protein
MNAPYQPQYAGAPQALPSSTLATVSMIAGILGFTAFPLIGTVVALIAGYQARKETRAAPPLASGDGMATAGIVMGWIQVGLLVVGVCCFVSYMVFMMGLFGSSLQGGQ